MSTIGDELREYLHETGASSEQIEDTMHQITVVSNECGKEWDEVALHLLRVLKAVATPDDNLDIDCTCY